MQITLDVHKIVVMEDRHGPDKVWLHVNNLPNPVWPYDEVSVTFEMQVAHGNGPKYVQDNFGMEPEVIRLLPENYKFSNKS